MFGIGFPEMIVILVVALIVVGPDKLPELARSLAKGVNELRGAMNQIKESLNEETKVISSVKNDLQQATVQMKDKLLNEEIGGPRQPINEDNEDAVVEMEADLAEEDSPRSWEDNAATVRRKQQKEQEAATLDKSEDAESATGEAVEEETVSEPAEERVIGKNSVQ